MFLDFFFLIEVFEKSWLSLNILGTYVTSTNYDITLSKNYTEKL